MVFLALGTVVAMALIVPWLSGAAPTADAFVSAKSPTENIPPGGRVGGSAEAAKYIGVGGCTASACHGGRPAGPNRMWKCSYTIWTSDPHNRAYTVLFEPRSMNIVRLLNRGAKEVHPEREARCLACHSVPGDPASGVSSEIVRIDGVGCEMCHGPAKNWIAAHTSDDWLAAFYADPKSNHLGMADFKNMRNLLSRAETCAGCHVGAPAEDGRPLRDVNHDLIAAGHPRLSFNFTAYLGVMPKHWTDIPGTKPDFYTQRTVPSGGDPAFRADSETHAEAWAIGQLVAAEAALRLLADRATAAGKSAQKDADSLAWAVRRPWPEFSEFECYACHHQLSDEFPSPRQRAASGSGRKLGAPPWAAWYTTELQPLAECKPFGADGGNIKGRIDDVKNSLSDQLGRLKPKEVAAKASAAKDELHKFAAQIDEALQASALSKMGRAEKVDPILMYFAQQKSDEANWDRAAQRFLTLDALWKAHQQAGQRGGDAGRDVTAKLEAVRKALDFGADLDSPAKADLAEVNKRLMEMQQAILKSL